MSRLINLSSGSAKLMVPVNDEIHTHKKDEYNTHRNVSAADSYNNNLELLNKAFPGKILYSIKDTASILGISYEYVRKNILSGKVKFKSFGDSKLVHVNELVKLISEGIAS